MAKGRGKPGKARKRAGRRTPGFVVPPLVGPRPMPVTPVAPRPRPVPPRPEPRPLPVGPVAPVPVPVVPNATPGTRAYVEGLVVEAQKLRSELATGFYRLGLLLRELSRPENFGMLGYGTFNELIEGRELTTPMNPYRLLSVVDELPQAKAEELGVEKSAALIKYAAVARPGEKVLALLQSDPVIQVRDKMARLSTVTAKELYEMVRGLARVSVPDVYRKRAQRASRGISQRLEHQGIESARVRSIARRGRMIVRIEVDGEEAGGFLDLLKKR